MSNDFDWELFLKTATIDEINEIGINTLDKFKRTMLHVVARTCNDPEDISELLKCGADFKAQDEDKKMPLHHAAENNRNFEVVSTLADAGATLDPVMNTFACLNHQDKDGRTPLHYALIVNPSDPEKNDQKPKIVLDLANAGNVDMPDHNGRTSLHYAAWLSMDIDITEGLLKDQADPNIKDKSGWLPFHYAVRYNSNPKVICRLWKETLCPQAKTNDEETAHDLIMLNPALKNGDPKDEKDLHKIREKLYNLFNE